MIGPHDCRPIRREGAVTRMRRLAARLALVLAGLAVGAALGELLLRALRPQALGQSGLTRSRNSGDQDHTVASHYSSLIETVYL